MPDLVERLKPPARRVKAVYVGSWEFDPKRVGFEWKSPFPRLPGNSNAGHRYGTDLSEPDRGP